MPHLFSIPISQRDVGALFMEVKWIIPPEAEVALQQHYPCPEMTLEKMFTLRARTDAIPHGWDWLLVVLPKRYPIGGYLAQKRQGPKSNLLLWDHKQCINWKVPNAQMTSTRARWFPSYQATSGDVHVSMFWVPTKGVLDAVGESAGGWLRDLANQLKNLPPTLHWVYMADAPSDGFVENVRRDNARLYNQWRARHFGPAWKPSTSQINRVKARFLLAVGNEPGPQSARLLWQYVKLCPSDARAWAKLADTFYRDGSHYRAAVAAHRAWVLTPQWVYPLYLLAVSQAARRRFTDAAFCCRTLLKDYPLDLTVLECLDLCLKCMGEREERVGVLRQLVRLMPASARHPLELGLLLYQRGECVEGEALFEKSLCLDPNFGLALNNYGYCLAERGKLNEALLLCERACQVLRTGSTVDSLGYVYMRLGRTEEAKKLFQEALVLTPGHKEAARHLCEAIGLV